MNGPIRKVSVVVMVMFLALMLNSTYSYLFRTDSLNADPANRRVRDSQFGTDRGDIMVGNTAIVTSTAVDDQYKFQRSYTQGTLYAPVTGYYSFLFGGSGLEKYYSAQLSGTSDSQFLQNLVNTATGSRPRAPRWRPPWMPARSRRPPRRSGTARERWSRSTTRPGP